MSPSFITNRDSSRAYLTNSIVTLQTCTHILRGKDLMISDSNKPFLQAYPRRTCNNISEKGKAVYNKLQLAQLSTIRIITKNSQLLLTWQTKKSRIKGLQMCLAKSLTSSGKDQTFPRSGCAKIPVSRSSTCPLSSSNSWQVGSAPIKSISKPKEYSELQRRAQK